MGRRARARSAYRWAPGYGPFLRNARETLGVGDECLAETVVRLGEEVAQVAGAHAGVVSRIERIERMVEGERLARDEVDGGRRALEHPTASALETTESCQLNSAQGHHESDGRPLSADAWNKTGFNAARSSGTMALAGIAGWSGAVGGAPAGRGAPGRRPPAERPPSAVGPPVRTLPPARPEAVLRRRLLTPTAGAPAARRSPGPQRRNVAEGEVGSEPAASPEVRQRFGFAWAALAASEARCTTTGRTHRAEIWSDATSAREDMNASPWRADRCVCHPPQWRGQTSPSS